MHAVSFVAHAFKQLVSATQSELWPQALSCAQHD